MAPCTQQDQSLIVCIAFQRIQTYKRLCLHWPECGVCACAALRFYTLVPNENIHVPVARNDFSFSQSFCSTHVYNNVYICSGGVYTE